MAGTPGADAPRQGRWLPFAEAAQALGVSERTLRRYVAARRLECRRARHRVQVFVSDEEVAQRALLGSPPDALHNALRAALEALERELAAEQRRAAQLAARIAAVEDECRQLADQAGAPSPAREIPPRAADQPPAIASDLEGKEPTEENSARPNLRGLRHDDPSQL